MKRYEDLRIKKTGLWRCTRCKGAGTTQITHCGKLTVFEAPREGK